eukprot:768724-Hanusia_phi.AAC.2
MPSVNVKFDSSLVEAADVRQHPEEVSSDQAGGGCAIEAEQGGNFQPALRLYHKEYPAGILGSSSSSQGNHHIHHHHLLLRFGKTRAEES